MPPLITMHPPRGRKGKGVALIGATRGCISISVAFFVTICWVCIPTRKIHVSKLGSSLPPGHPWGDSVGTHQQVSCLTGKYSRKIHVSKLGSSHSTVESLSYYAPPSRGNAGDALVFLYHFWLLYAGCVYLAKKLMFAIKDSLTVL